MAESPDYWSLLTRYYEPTIRLLLYCQDLPSRDQQTYRALRYLVETQTDVATSDHSAEYAIVWQPDVTILVSSHVSVIIDYQVDNDSQGSQPQQLRRQSVATANLVSVMLLLAEFQAVEQYYYDLTPHHITSNFLRLVQKAQDLLESQPAEVADLAVLAPQLELEMYSAYQATGRARYDYDTNFNLAMQQLNRYRALAGLSEAPVVVALIEPSYIQLNDLTSAQWLLGRDFTTAKTLLAQTNPSLRLRLYQYDPGSFSKTETVPEVLNTDDLRDDRINVMVDKAKRIVKILIHGDRWRF